MWCKFILLFFFLVQSKNWVEVRFPNEILDRNISLVFLLFTDKLCILPMNYAWHNFYSVIIWVVTATDIVIKLFFSFEVNKSFVYCLMFSAWFVNIVNRSKHVFKEFVRNGPHYQVIEQFTNSTSSQKKKKKPNNMHLPVLYNICLIRKSNFYLQNSTIVSTHNSRTYLMSTWEHIFFFTSLSMKWRIHQIN